ncbi:MAG: TonB-dependent receptor [Synoicihabitans sp.]
MKSFFTTLSLGVALSAAAQHAHEHPETDHLHLEKFEVTTHPYARSQNEIAQPTTVLGGHALEVRPALNLGELVAQEPGVSSSYFGPGSARPVIRGLAGPRIAVLQNGSDMIDASTISPDHAVSIDPLLIERVEITRGPAALLQGGSAIGGAVNVVTHRIHATKPPPGVHGRIEGRVGDSDNERSGGIVLEGGWENVAWHLDAFSRETDNIEIPGFAESLRLRRLEELEEHDEHHDEEEHEDEDHHDEEHEEEDDHDHEDEEEAFGMLPNSWVESSGGAAGLSWIGENGYIGASFSFFDTRYGIPPGAHSHEHGHDEHDEHEHEEEEHEEEDHHEEEGEEHHDEEEEFVSIDLEQRRFEIEGEWREPFAGVQALRWHWSWADYEHTEFEGDEVGTVFSNEGHDLRIDALHQPWGDWQGAFGFAWSYSDFDAVGAEAFVPPTDTETVSALLFEELERGPTIWQLSARLDAQSIDVQDGTGRKADGTGWATSLGIVHELDEHWNVTTSLSLTERLPIAQELFADGPHIGTNAYEVGDAGLDNERSLGFDIGLHHQTEWLSTSVTAFANDFDGYIYENPTGAEEDGLIVYEFTQRDARFYGAEFEGMLHVLQSDHGHLDLTFGMDFVHAKNRSESIHLPRIAPWRWRTGFTWHRGPWRAGSEVVFAEGADRLAPGELRTDAYELVSAYAGYRFIAGATTWDLLLRGSNLTDSEARLHTSFLKDIAPLPGRNITASVRMSF